MRTRFQPPRGDWRDPEVLARIIRAGITDSADREPDVRDYAYWRGHWPELVARGQEIHVDAYAWLRLIGWQAGGPDTARYGPYAVPPNEGPPGGWTTPFVHEADADAPAAPIAEPTPRVLTADDAAHALFDRLAAIEAQQAGILDALRAMTLAAAHDREVVTLAAKELQAALFNLGTAPPPSYHGTLTGRDIILRPTPAPPARKA